MDEIELARTYLQSLLEVDVHPKPSSLPISGTF